MNKTMACILKIPTQLTPGVVTFTTAERSQLIESSRSIQDSLRLLKERWMIGLHHNWHDYQFRYNPLFDFSMAGEGDLKEVNGTSFKLVPLDACNFVPDFFEGGSGEKFWDVLYVARAVFFKKIPEFFQCVRTLFDQGHRLRILFLCPIPPYRRADRRTAFFDIRKVYDSMFSPEEQNLFTLLTMDFGYPFPLDLPTLAHFYRSSKTFVHFADDERRCRVAAYAWASGLSVVGMSCIGTLLPPALRKPPVFYEVQDYREFPGMILNALANQPSATDCSLARGAIGARQTKPILKRLLIELMKQDTTDLGEVGWFLDNLDLRLGRHHGLGDGPNTVQPTLENFIARLLQDDWSQILSSEQPDDVEKAIAGLTSLKQAPLLQRIFQR